MLRPTLSSLPVVRARLPTLAAGLSTSAAASNAAATASAPNPRMHLDPTLQALLRDVDISLINNKAKEKYAAPKKRELEVFPQDAAVVDVEPFEEEKFEDERMHRKSPAALFGSEKIGSLVLPNELQREINLVVADADKHKLREDALRLFGTDVGGEDSAWSADYDVSYGSREQRMRHLEGDGTAFATVALPPHYAAIASVLRHLRQRIEPDFRLERVLEWGSGAGSGIWASMHVFQEKLPNGTYDTDLNDLKILSSTISSYTSIEKREGLRMIGKHLLKNMGLSENHVNWQKAYHEEDILPRNERNNAMAMSAFALAAQPNPLARRRVVKQMWESGAELMVLIDHNTKDGFEAIAEARDWLLRQGSKELEESESAEYALRGAHVIAPCPHDGACPLYNPGATKLVCGFSQRLHRPSFTRRTKHTKFGHENIGYSYVVIRRGPRPARATTSVGRIGEVGRRELEKKAEASVVPKELMLQVEHERLVAAGESGKEVLEKEEGKKEEENVVSEPLSGSALEAALRHEAYSWPRLIFPPLKRSKHVILDACTAEAKILRMTIPKSQGKQPYYDARKSEWGDMFPHPPKNRPQERFQAPKGKGEAEAEVQGADIGKRKVKGMKKPVTYEAIEDELKKKQKREDRARALERKELRRAQRREEERDLMGEVD
ncbi:Rsm22-domain-containing protein [Schizophyllum commune Loenen D]|nr:Rsm22-domain-containing protein [Schizophyllum commune Loenen D]